MRDTRSPENAPGSDRRRPAGLREGGPPVIGPTAVPGPGRLRALQRSVGNSAVTALLAHTGRPTTAPLPAVQREVINIPLPGVGRIETDDVDHATLVRYRQALERLLGDTETVVVRNAYERLNDALGTRAPDVVTPGRTTYWYVGPQGRVPLSIAGRLDQVVNRLNPHPHHRNYSAHGGHGSPTSPTGSYVQNHLLEAGFAFHVLPAGPRYLEAVYAPPGAAAGLTRVIMGDDHSVYFTDDHYYIYYRVFAEQGGTHIEFG
ncbi:hypothetical protein [Oceanitalea stevensii]|uniref:Uncharacterized protein n=1 Tax=Oceanitalea stevensii TaxID=2763072 RepID=A0ABR8YXQ4_9MICO|nr:hypothetical protein [Oceanitalea stevensii]MBD8060810.1 hypothetical protein [Oceanitalea stevensii]